MTPALEAIGLQRRFGSGGGHLAVDGVDLRVAPGQVVALLGPNGAGKTTTVKMCSTMLTPTAGVIRVDGDDAVRNPRHVRRKLGLVLGGERGFYGRATARDNLLFFADILAVPTRLRRERVASALDAVGLTDRERDRVQEFSRGMLQRLHIARALLSAPALLLLDEPTNGLDPEIARDVRSLVTELADGGVGILLTTHYLHEAEQLADQVVVLIDGRVLVEGSVDDIARHAGITHVTTLSVAGRLDLSMLSTLGPARQVVESRDGRTYARLSWTSTPDHRDLRNRVEDAVGFRVDELTTRASTLEESYLALVDHSRRGA